jgi:hypothetical protein
MKELTQEEQVARQEFWDKIAEADRDFAEGNYLTAAEFKKWIESKVGHAV